MKKYDIAAYIWPSYTGTEMRSRIFWPDGIGEWQTVKNSKRKNDSYYWHREPLWGYRDEADPKVMEFQIDEATRHGVNVFIYDWYWYDHRPFLEQCLDDGFLSAGNRDKMKFYLMWANHDADYLWDKRLAHTIWSDNCPVWLGAVDRTEFDRVVDRVIQRYFSQPNYYKIDNKPVFMIYDIENLIKGLGGVANTREALDYFRRKTVEAGFAGLELQLTLWGERIFNVNDCDGNRKVTTTEIVPRLGFDSLTNYQMVHFCNMKNDDYSVILSEADAEWKRIDSCYSIPYYPHVSAGWDNNPRFENYIDYYCSSDSPANFEANLRMAKEYIDSHKSLRAPLITLNSWNEWTESSYLQPDDRFGYGFLEAVKKVFVDEL